MPAVYAGAGKNQRRERAAQLLQRLGLGSELIIAQVSCLVGNNSACIARALMNGADNSRG